MQRRITIAILAVAIAAVVLAGIGTTLLAWAQARESAVEQLREEAQALEPFVTREIVREVAAAQSESVPTTRSQRLRQARDALSLVDASVLIVDDGGRIASGEMPAGVDTGSALAATHDSGPRDGVAHGLAWASASSEPAGSGRRVIVVLTRRIAFPVGALRWVTLSGLVAAALAVLAAWLLARRITGPLREIEVATRRIADGDLSARVGGGVVGEAGVSGRHVARRSLSAGTVGTSGMSIGHGPNASSPGDEIASLSDSIDQMADSLQRARDTEQQFLLSISHDLRTPLTSVRGYAEAIGDGAVDDPRAAAAVIQREAQRLERLVADLLNLARLEARQFTLHLDEVDLAALVNSAVGGFLPAAAAASIELAVEGTTTALPMRLDADRVGQILANVIENALKFATSRVVVALRSEPGWVHVSVSDDGPGIDPQDLPRVFERSYVARSVPETNRPRPTGSGLGLAIARELVGIMGGTITAGPNRVGQGTEVAFRIPRA